MRFIIAIMFSLLATPALAEQTIQAEPISEKQCRALAEKMQAVDKDITDIKISTEKFEERMPDPSIMQVSRNMQKDYKTGELNLDVYQRYNWKERYLLVGNACRIAFLGAPDPEKLFEKLKFDVKNPLVEGERCGYGGSRTYVSDNSICSIYLEERCKDCGSCKEGEGCGDDECKKMEYYGWIDCVKIPEKFKSD